MSGFIAKNTPLDWYIFEIDNWFDAKWLKFSGKTLGALGVWKSDTTIPPFNPNRITRWAQFEKNNRDGKWFYKKVSSPDQIHIHQSSGENLNRKISHFTKDGMFIWYSGNTEDNAFGSILIYLIKEKKTRQLYICLKDNKKQNNQDSIWIIHKNIGITQQELENLIDLGKTNKLWDNNDL